MELNRLYPLLGCNEGVGDGRCLLLCSFCYSSWHPTCAGLAPSIKRYQDDWACPECVYIAENDLQMQPLHLDPGAEVDLSAPVDSPFDTVDSEEDPDTEPPRDMSLKWLRWVMSHEIDFLAQQNLLTDLVTSRGHKVLFLPKFHCELNIAELYWSMLKACVRRHVDGKWGTMTKAVWLAFGTNNMPLELGQRFARKCRELLDLCSYEIDGPFAQHYQKMMNAHRGAFFDAHALKPWADGSEAACAKSVDGAKMSVGQIQGGPLGDLEGRLNRIFSILVA